MVTFWKSASPNNRLVDINGNWDAAFQSGETYQMYFEDWTVTRPVLCADCRTLCETFVDDKIQW
jgi:hypothetical protein